MINISPSAAKEIRRLLSRQHAANVFRLQVQAGGCSGFLYDMKIDTSVKPGDQVHDCSGMTVVIDAQSWNYVSNLRLDYSEDLMGGGFRFYNPQAITTCSCGNSFSTSADLQIP